MTKRTCKADDNDMKKQSIADEAPSDIIQGKKRLDKVYSKENDSISSNLNNNATEKPTPAPVITNLPGKTNN